MKPNKSNPHRLWSLFTTLTLTLASQGPLQAANLYWDGTTTTADADGGAGTWSTGATTNWDTAATAGTDVVWTDGSDAVFGGAAGAVTVSGTISTPSLTFSTTGYSTTGGTITLTGTPFVDTGAGSATVGSVLAGGAGLSKNGSGTLTLSGANTYTGTLTVSAGTLKAGNGGALGAGGTGNGTTVQSGATLDINGQALTNTEIVTVSGTGVGANGALVNAGADQQNALNKLVLAANATIGGTGRFDIRPGTTPTLDLAGFTLTKEGTNQLSLVGATITPGSITINAGTVSVETTSTLTGTGTVTINANGSLGLYGTTGTNITRGITSNGGAIKNLGSGATINSAITLAASTTTTLGSPNTQATTLAGILSGTGALTKTGTDTFTLSAVNTYTGNTTVNGGTLVLSNTNRSAAYSVATGAVLEMQNLSMPVNASISGAGTLRKTQTGTLVWPATAATFSMGSGALIDVQAGTFTGGNSANEVWTSNLSDLNVASGAIFDGVEANVRVDVLTGSGTVKTGYSGAGYSALTIGVDNGSGTFAGAITNSTATGSLTKTGTGTQILSGTNTYTGATTINGGVLEVAGSGALASTPVTVNATGTLRSDTVGKTFAAITAANNSTLLMPAQTGGTTTVTGTLNLADSATISVAPLLGNLAAGTYDLVTAGSITGTGTPVLNLASNGPTRATGSVQVTGNKLQLVLTGTGANLVWNNASAAGVATGTWDNTLLNFNNGGGNDAFQSFDAVTFDDTLLSGTAKTVNLTGTLTPSLVTVNNSNGNYTFGSTGILAGSGSLVKSGSSTLTLAGTASYSMNGSITASGGTLDLGGKSIQPSSVTLAGGTFNNATVTAGTLDFQSGTAGATFTGASPWTKSTAGTVTLNAANTLTGAGTLSAGTLSLGSTATIGSGTVSLAGGTTLAVSRSANALALSNAFTGTGAITITGTNNGAATNASEVVLNGNNSGFSGPVSVAGARASLTSSTTAGGTGPLTVSGAGGQFFLGGGTYTNNFFLTGNGWAEGAGILGALRFGAVGTVTGTITLTGNSRITSYGSSGTISGPIVESGGARNLEFGVTGGSNNITLSGTSTYTGTTTVTNATVTLNGSLGATAVTVASGSTLGGTGSIGSGGSLAFAGTSNLNVNAAAAALTVNGPVSLGTTTTVAVSNATGGVVTVLNYTGAVTGTTANLALANAANYRQSVFNIGANKITVDLGNKALVWNGTSGGQWNLGGANLRWNTTGSGETDAFFQGDGVTFDETGVTTVITLAGAVQPASVTVNSTTKNYTLTGAGANVIGGLGGLTKSGASTLTLTGAANTYTGGTTVNGGTLSLGLGGGAGTIRGPLTINSGATVTTTVSDAIGYTVGSQVPTLTINGGTFNNASTGNEGFTTNVVLTGGTISSTGGGAFNFTNSYGITSTASSTTSLISSPVLIRDTNNLPVAVAAGTTTSGIDLDVTGVISGTGTALTKSGAGVLRMSGANTYTVGTTISAGTLVVANATGSATGTGAVVTAAGTTLAGTGTITGAVTSAGTVSPGAGGTGTLTTGAATLTGTLAIEVDGANADKLMVTGNLTLTGAPLSLSVLGGGFSGTYVIAEYTGTLTGTFASVPAGYTVTYNAGVGNKQILLTQSPYGAWAQANGLTTGNSGPSDDPDHDGIPNLLEYVLSSQPLSLSLFDLPGQSLDGTNLTFYFTRNKQSKQDTPLKVQWGTNLTTWTDIVVPDHENSEVQVNESNPSYDLITVSIPRSNAVNGKLFVRLKASQP